MARDLRGLIFVAALVIIAAIVISIPRVNFSVVNFEFDRGNEDSFLGLSLGLDLQGGTHLIYDIIPAEGEVPTAEDVEAIRTIIERRVNAFGVSEPTVQVLGNPPDRILIQLPGQSQSSLNVSIDGADVTPEDVEAFFETDLGESGVEVFVNEDASMIVTFDEFDGREADDWLMQFREKHPATLRATFEYEITVPELDPTTSIATDDETDAATDSVDDQIQLPDPIRVAPTTEAVQAAFEAAGFEDVVVSDGTDTILFLTDEVGGFQQVDAVFFEAEFKGELQERTFDAEGNILPSDIEDLTRQLADIGNFATIRSPGYVTQWTVSGGVQEAKALIGSTAQLEFRERKCGPIIPPSDVPAEEWPPDGLSETEWLLLRCASPLYFTEQA
ncbi:MAG: hypothetical protein F4Y88_08810, partial [Chloroflexi bacterium]|nr:hypothetical protein [Chloroflexota bacterium]